VSLHARQRRPTSETRGLAVNCPYCMTGPKGITRIASKLEIERCNYGRGYTLAINDIYVYRLWGWVVLDRQPDDVTGTIPLWGNPMYLNSIHFTHTVSYRSARRPLAVVVDSDLVESLQHASKRPCLLYRFRNRKRRNNNSKSYWGQASPNDFSESSPT